MIGASDNPATIDRSSPVEMTLLWLRAYRTATNSSPTVAASQGLVALARFDTVIRSFDSFRDGLLVGAGMISAR
jgi:hypothetical protein